MANRHRDDKARRAEPALRPVMLDHRLLHGVQRAMRPGDPLDSPHRTPVELRQEQDAGVQRPRAVLVGDHHRAGPAIALVAALLGAGQAPLVAQPVKQSRRGRRIDLDSFPVQRKPDHEKSRRLTRTIRRHLRAVDAA